MRRESRDEEGRRGRGREREEETGGPRRQLSARARPNEWRPPRRKARVSLRTADGDFKRGLDARLPDAVLRVGLAKGLYLGPRSNSN